MRTLVATGKGGVRQDGCAHQHLQPVAQNLTPFHSNSGGSATVPSIGNDINSVSVLDPGPSPGNLTQGDLLPLGALLGCKAFKVWIQQAMLQVSQEKLHAVFPALSPNLVDVGIPMTM